MPGPPPPPRPSRIHVLFEPIFFLMHVTIDVFLNGEKIGTGSTEEGIDISVPAKVGRNQLELDFGPRYQSFFVEVPRSTLMEVRLVYSRMWGNVKLKKTAHPL